MVRPINIKMMPLRVISILQLLHDATSPTETIIPYVYEIEMQGENISILNIKKCHEFTMEIYVKTSFLKQFMK